mgnify:CR=1 FL=1
MKDILIKKKEDGSVYPIEVTHVACQNYGSKSPLEDTLQFMLPFIRERALDDFVNKFYALYVEYYHSLPYSLLMYNIFAKRYELTSKFHIPSFDMEDTITDLTLIAEKCAEKINSKILGTSLTKDDVCQIWGEMPYINYGYMYHKEADSITWFYNISR